MGRLSAVVFSAYALLLASCAGSSSQAPHVDQQPQANTGLPAPGTLDQSKEAQEIVGTAIDLAGYAQIQLAEYSDGQVIFSPTEREMAFVLYAVDPPTDAVIELQAEGEGDLWLLVFDFADGRWSAMAQFVDGEASIDLTAMGQPLSDEGLLYFSVVCEAGGSGTLTAAVLAYDNYIYEWHISAQVAGDGINLFWSAMPFDGYHIYRSTLANDEAGFHVGTVQEVNIGNNSFREEIHENEYGQWRYMNMNNGTPEDISDDFPSLAPAIRYYYYIVPLKEGEELPVRSPEVNATIPWGGRLIVHREFPDATDKSYFMADELSSEVMTEAQAEFAANHYIGAAVIDETGLEMVRKYNPGFIGLKSVMVNPAGPEPDFPGVITDGDKPDYYWSYINRHESWFGHDDASEYLNKRIAIYWGPDDHYFMDPATQWADYVVNSGLQQLGENFYDGVFLSNLHGWLGTEPANYGFPGEYWEALQDSFNWLTPRFDVLIGKAAASGDSFPSQPLQVANAWLYPDLFALYPDLFSEIDYSPLDGVYADHQIEPPSVPESQGGGWDVSIDYQISELQQGQCVILNESGFSSTDYDNFFAYCSYLMLRQGKAYFYNRNTFHTGYEPEPFWSGLFDWQSGAPLDDPPDSMNDLLVSGTGDFGTLYRRDFENGSVLIAFGYSNYEVPGGIEQWEFVGYGSSGGGNDFRSLPVSDSGEPAATELNWRPLSDHIHIGNNLELEDECIIIRPTQSD